MKPAEEELQNQVEKGNALGSSEEVRAYQRVFDALKKEPEFHVSLPFADRIIAIIEKREEKRDYWWLAAGIFLTVIALIVSLALTSAHWSAGVFTFLSGYSGLIVFGIVFILILQWVDKKILSKYTAGGNP